MTSSSCRDKIEYIYQLPFLTRSELCKILNQNDKWEELAGIYMKYDVLTIQTLRKEKNPTDELLTLWGHHNHTILELFVLLSRMQHYQSMLPLIPFVEEKFHKLFYNGEGNFCRLLGKQLNKNTKDLKIGKQNFNHIASPEPNVEKITKEESYKILNKPMQAIHIGVSPSNSNNLLVTSLANPLPVTLSCVPTNKKKDDNVLKPEATIPCVIYNELNIATNEWNKNNILGRGGFGTVYREDRLRMRRKSQPLSWIQRHEIAKGTACGLQYLHTIGEKPLIHGDIKSANILLDKNFEPRIGDFGLAREGLENDSMKVSKIHGTRPYLPEEFLHERKLSTKVDTYSYGIVLFELATGLPVYDESRLENKFLKDLIGTLENENLVSLIDKKAGEKNKQVFDNFMILGKWCSNHQAENRPEMYNVFKKLNDL